jgi:glycosyltransferase involved in cell wall biosynthesis
MSGSRTLLVSALRGSGGAYTHLSRVLPRLRRLLSSWRIELHASSTVLQACFGETSEDWMRPLPDDGYAARTRWELVDLPRRLRANPDALLWAPFGPPLNVLLAPRAIWISQNLLPLLPSRELELGAADRLRIRTLRPLYRAWARNARRTICVSWHARERLARLAGVEPHTIAVIKHGVDPAQGTRPCSTDELEKVRATQYLLNVGQPIAYRRTRELVGAYAILAKRRPEAPPLVVVGKARSVDAAYERECLDSLRPLLRSGRARVLGQVSHADTLALMASAHTFAYPSVHEDCPNVVLEALAARRVGVYADIPAVRELADDAGLMVPDPQPERLAAELERAVFDPAERARVADAAHRRTTLFDWDRAAEQTAAVIEAAAARDSRPAGW